MSTPEHERYEKNSTSCGWRFMNNTSGQGLPCILGGAPHFPTLLPREHQETGCTRRSPGNALVAGGCFKLLDGPGGSFHHQRVTAACTRRSPGNGLVAGGCFEPLDRPDGSFHHQGVTAGAGASWAGGEAAAIALSFSRTLAGKLKAGSKKKLVPA